MSNRTLQAILPTPDTGVRLDGISHLAVSVADLDEALAFYGEVLGFGPDNETRLPQCGKHGVVRAASGQRVALCENPTWKPLAETGIHNAYRVTQAGLGTILDRLRERGHQILRYREARDSEQRDNFYCLDPSGNRIQLVTSWTGETTADGSDASDITIRAIDHAAIQAIDVEWEESFYIGEVGLTAVEVFGWRTADYVLARHWGDGEEDLAPGTMRWDKRFFTYAGQKPTVARPNVQLFVRAGANDIGIYLADKHFQEPPEKTIVGTPRIAIAVRDRTDLERLAEILRRSGRTVVGPSAHDNSSSRRFSIYCKDPGANFLEFCC